MGRSSLFVSHRDDGLKECVFLFRYPFPISRSSMLAPGTSHQWPHHLSALGWLCELLIYESEVFHTEEVGPCTAAAPPPLEERSFHSRLDGANSKGITTCNAESVRRALASKDSKSFSVSNKARRKRPTGSLFSLRRRVLTMPPF